MSVALIDVDGTLLTGPRSSEALFIRYLLRHGILGPRQAGAAAWFMVRHGPAHGRHAFRKNKAYLAGLKLADMEAIAETFTGEVLEPILDRPLLKRISEHRAAGIPILLLTGTPDFLAAPLARLVRADGWRAARYAVRDGVFQATLPVEHPLGPDKVKAATALCAEAGANLGDATAYADSVHDLPLLLKVRQPVAVRPDARLRAEAIKRGWEVMDAAPGEDPRMPQGRPTHA
ncbi:MAG: haloacid dehalogenase-like hydrolase [Alphaproteobacteria bacterium]|nr:haloacid dehalogenase-like hydrolase [Alphaproteobacteria bacterium]